MCGVNGEGAGDENSRDFMRQCGQTKQNGLQISITMRPKRKQRVGLD